ncbi:protein SOGA3a isoform X10 [Hippocampus zosterae]|uniref:protein SOGA3a isoform X10 n=1 Tax=Hippocampus zosterae TaxID=109293 RepID=UPI00223E131F|nr:protein SOGA3a isoform X10 [Hippocampus zosterae]
MWSALLNGSGLHGGGGAAGGYVPSQGWEFVPCTRLEKTGKGKNCSSPRRISSPPIVFRNICDALPGESEGGTGTKLEFLKGQMPPDTEAQQQQHTRLKKKFEDLKKRHVQDKEKWMWDKEVLLREVADIQAGENRRILLDLKTVLEEVQVEVKREEEKRSDLQLQYNRDRCAWELERAELKCCIAQALKEIARVSEELCSYQDEIKKKSEDKSQSELYLSEENIPADSEHTGLKSKDATYDLNHICQELKELEKENWITLSPDYTWRANRGSKDSWESNSVNSCKDVQKSPVALFPVDTEAPHVPPRNFPRNRSSPSQTDTELHIPESPITTMTKCHSPCVTIDQQYGSPSIVRKFEAMLKENEGKVFIDGAVASCSIPKNSNCNIGCCHNRWSCDATKFTCSKLSRCGTVQKSFSEANILTSRKDRSPYSAAIGNLHNHQRQTSSVLTELLADLLMSSLEISSTSPNLHGSRRNIMLEKKTAEFNRTLFQAEMGYGVDEEYVTEAGAHSVGCQPAVKADCVPDKHSLARHCADDTTGVMDVNVEIAFFTPTSNLPIQNTKDKVSPSSYKVQEARMKNCTSSINITEQSNTAVREANTRTSRSPAHLSEVQQNVQTARNPSRKTQIRSPKDTPLSESALSANIYSGQSVKDAIYKRDTSSRAQIQPARVDISLQEPSAQSKLRQITLPRLESVPPSQMDCSTPATRKLKDHPWKPLTLAAYPRPEGSRSNYGALERILKHYENAAKSPPQDEKAMGPNVSLQQDDGTGLNMRDMTPNPTAPPLRQLSRIETSTTLKTHSNIRVAQIQQQMQDEVESDISFTQNIFSKPVHQANRRLSSRWASRSPTSPASATASPCITTV